MPDGTYANTAELIALDTFDPDSTPNNNLSSEDDQATVVPVPGGLADLSLTKIVDNASPNVGDVVRFTLSVTNDGLSDATGVVIQDQLPVGFTYQSHVATSGIYDSATGIWTLNGAILHQDTENLEILALVNAPTGAVDEYLSMAFTSLTVIFPTLIVMLLKVSMLMIYRMVYPMMTKLVFWLFHRLQIWPLPKWSIILVRSLVMRLNSP